MQMLFYLLYNIYDKKSISGELFLYRFQKNPAALILLYQKRKGVYCISVKKFIYLYNTFKFSIIQ